MIPNNSLSRLTSTKYDLTSINCHISQRVSFYWTTFHYFRSGSSIRKLSCDVFTRVGDGHLVRAGNYLRDSFRSLPSFSRRYSFADPCGGQTMYHKTHAAFSEIPLSHLYWPIECRARWH